MPPARSRFVSTMTVEGYFLVSIQLYAMFRSVQFLHLVEFDKMASPRSVYLALSTLLSPTHQVYQGRLCFFRPFGGDLEFEDYVSGSIPVVRQVQLGL